MKDPLSTDLRLGTDTETNRDKALRGEPVLVSIGRLREMQEQAIRFEGIDYESYHWHWAAALNELLARREGKL